ncbi:MbnP family protein [Algoriphagus sp.]|uniref:MbnP family protein n=1 Tax=Algoriphagus sp. TaxID=1872435 RepID=UPI00391AC400
MKNIAYLFLAAILIFSSCSEDEIPAQMAVEINFENTLNGKPLQLNGGSFTLPSGEPFTAKKLKYYISNVILTDTKGGAIYTVPASYHLIGQDINTKVDLGLIPSAGYDQITFSIGVDAEANAKTDQTGDLDPNSDMAWNWNSGYKFVVLEGEFTSKANGERKGLIFHIGRNQNYKTVTQTLSGIRAGSSATINLQTVVDQLFLDPNPLKVSELPSTTIMGGEWADKIGQNYANGFVKIK